MDRGSTALNVRIVESILEPKGITSFRKLTELQSVNDGDFRKIVVALPGSLKYGLQAGVVFRIYCKRDVHICCAERILPVSWRIVTDIVENGSPRRHALAEFFGEAVQRRLRHSHRLEALIRESDAQPARKTRFPPFVRRCYMWEKAVQHFPPLCCVVDAKNHVFAFVRTRAWAQYCSLYVAHVESGSVGHRHSGFNLRLHCFCASPFRRVLLRQVYCRGDAPAFRRSSDEIHHAESRDDPSGVLPEPHSIYERSLSVENIDIAPVER